MLQKAATCWDRGDVAAKAGGAYRLRGEDCKRANKAAEGRRVMNRLTWRLGCAVFGATAALLVLGKSGAVAQECKHRGQHDAQFCDEDDDLVADAPTDPGKW